ncbi:hypothetical protein BKA70DRAFT_1257861 [Coprinopsis sp. MPI-PUGE-AT-0042]|nr:hypothetical protein BKA70DRAFT_1257861 [Coprinopsis sp. MPI-PUGE-AT-0042]
MAIDSPSSVSVDEYQELLRRLSKDKELVKKLQDQAIQKDILHKEEVEELQGRVLRAENSAKWMAERNKELEAQLEGREDVQALEKKLQHAMKVIMDLVAKERSSDSNLYDSDPDLYQEILSDARSRNKGKGRVVRHDTPSSGTSQSSQRTPRPASTARPPSTQGSPALSAQMLSPMTVSTSKGTPLSRLSEASSPPTPADGQEEYAEAQESQPWLEEVSSSASSMSSHRSSRPSRSRKSITTASGACVQSIDWVYIPASAPASAGPYPLEDLQTKLGISSKKFQGLKTLESMEGIGIRLQIVRRSRDIPLVFVYKPIWYEKAERGRDIDPLELCLIDWAREGACEMTSDYLEKRGIGHEESESPVTFHVFCYPSNGEDRGWWYIGAMNWQQVIFPPLVPTLERKGSKKLIKHLSERSQLPYTDIEEMFSQGDLKQMTIKMVPQDKSIAINFCESVLGVDAGSSTGSG